MYPQKIKLTKVSTTALSAYDVFVNGICIGTVSSWETYIWDIDSPYVSALANSCRTRHQAIARLVADYNKKNIK